LTPEEVTKRRSSRSGNGGAYDTGEESGVTGSVEWSCGRDPRGVQFG
jgi:hypothetical protein